MTAPVVQEGDRKGGRFVIGFVMPANLGVDELPVPSDPNVRTRRVPAQTAAARRFSGRWSRSSYEKHHEELVDALAKSGLRVAGQPRYARYDPPWTPWFLRRNEVVQEVDDTGAGPGTLA